MKKNDKDRLAGIIGTVCVHALLLILLLFTVFDNEPLEVDELSGVLVQSGVIDEAKGTFEPSSPQQTVTPVPENTSSQPSEEDMITQDDEQTVKLAEEKKKKEQDKKKEKEELRRKEQQKREEEERKKVDNLIAGKFKNTKNQGSKGNSASGQGAQGSVSGNSNEGKTSGVGGYGDYDLGGRSIGGEGLPRPAVNAQESGVVVVNIVVDSQGNVIKTDIAKGTTIANQTIRRASLAAAAKAKFNSVTTKNNQSGTITYRFVVR